MPVATVHPIDRDSTTAAVQDLPDSSFQLSLLGVHFITREDRPTYLHRASFSQPIKLQPQYKRPKVFAWVKTNLEDVFQNGQHEMLRESYCNSLIGEVECVA
ncbi:hypothetical protein SNOG_02828 [Parastagonospora nodorum SN15]|uniref:Uncharacterized protein n=1 Tax=Phaeosphaeria nodorum (strain SN15 / ATCC MYA-4574 / FGSC 10173) TaxID=321614 RepID=Q0UZI6_PHANO|nr:hypothetical protein SNOG_02828 [Parastagonospora nodorum SN15]EAT89559.1 hypothetical protein SNOG_02828 [Parastagonospora nodorum SN15]